MPYMLQVYDKKQLVAKYKQTKILGEKYSQCRLIYTVIKKKQKQKNVCLAQL